jgi:hypothetical protein
MTTTIEEVKAAAATPYFIALADDNLDEYLDDLAQPDTRANAVCTDYTRFERYGKNQKQWWRAQLIQMAGGDVHFFWLDGELFLSESTSSWIGVKGVPPITTIIKNRRLAVQIKPVNKQEALAGMLLCAGDGGYFFTSWREFFRLTEVPGDAKALPPAAT